MPTALLSVYDKSGIVDLARGLDAASWRILSSGKLFGDLRKAAEKEWHLEWIETHRFRVPR